MGSADKTSHTLTTQWWVTNLALVTGVSLGLSFVGLIKYAELVGIPLRVVTSGVRASLPWFLMSLLIVCSFPLMALVFSFAFGRLKAPGGRLPQFSFGSIAQEQSPRSP